MNENQDEMLLWVGRQKDGIAAASITASGYAVREVVCSRKAQVILRKDRFHAIVLDLSGSHEAELQDLRRLVQQDQPLEVIAVNGEPCVEKALQTVKAGVWDYLPYPLCVETLVNRLAKHRHDPSNCVYNDPVAHFVCEHASAISTRSEVAQRFGLSPDTVSSRARCATGKTFTEFLHACRLQQARHSIFRAFFIAMLVCRRLVVVCNVEREKIV